MKPSIRPVAVTFLMLIAVTALWLTYAAADAGSRFRDDPRNLRGGVELDGPRGQIVTADDVVVALDGDGARRYPQGPAYAHLVGYDTGEAATGLEATRHRDLQTRDDGSLTSLLTRLTGGDLGPADVRLTIVDAVQRVAVEALEGHTGAVIALDPRTGAVLAYASSPTFDPNDVVSGSMDPTDIPPGLDRVSQRLLPPGSTFKVVVAAAALGAGAGVDTMFDDSAAYQPPGGMPIRNANERLCRDGTTISLLDALVVSCNTVFAELAVELGGLVLVGTAERLGFNRTVPWELGAQRSVIPPAPELDADVPALAQSGIGERDVRVSAMHMAIITAAIANGGVAVTPHAVAAVVSGDGSVVSATTPRSSGRVMTREVAEALRDMMMQVVTRGTGTAAAVPGIEVAGKTGTAEGGGGPHAWFIGFAPADDPRIAVVVVIESGGSGGRIAAPIASRIIAAWMN